jgi:hypothetical protein
MPRMARCPQCGADVTVGEEDRQPRCTFCGTSFAATGERAGEHLIVSWGASPGELIEAVRDYWLRGDPRRRSAAPPHLGETRKFFLPYLTSSAASPSPARTSSRSPPIGSSRGRW